MRGAASLGLSEEAQRSTVLFGVPKKTTIDELGRVESRKWQLEASCSRCEPYKVQIVVSRYSGVVAHK